MRPQLSDLTNNQPIDPETAANYHNAMMCTRLAGRAIIKVVGKCNDAQENENLDLSSCQLMQIPDAVFHLMRNTALKTCDLSFNVITKIPAKLSTKFSCLTELNLSNNRISKLPDELGDLQELVKLDISFNAFCTVPRMVYSLPKLEYMNAEKNYIIDVDTNCLRRLASLATVNLKQNPISQSSHDALSSVTSFTVHLSPRVLEEWEKWSEELK